MTLPRDDYERTDIRAWLFDGERKWLAALDCRDLSASLEVSVLLVEHRDEHGRRKKGRKYAHGSGTPEQCERERVAGELIEDRMSAMFNARKMLVAIADLRCQVHEDTP